MNHLFHFRLTLIIGQIFMILANTYWHIWPQASSVLCVICLSYFILIVFCRWYGFDLHRKRLMIVIDLLLWAAFFALLDGVANPLIWCLLIPTVLSSLSQSAVFTWWMTLSSNLVYLWLWSLGVHMDSFGGHGAMMANHIIGMWVGFVAVSLLLTWMATTLMLRIKQKNLALIEVQQQRQADENIIKMATLATSLAHELGTPLASIRLLVDELRYAIDNPSLDKDLQLLDSQVSRCKATLQELTEVVDQSNSDETEIKLVMDFINQLFDSRVDKATAVMIENHMNQAYHILVDELFKLACLNVINNSIAIGAQKILVGLYNTDKHIVIEFKDEGGNKQSHHHGLGIGLKLSSRIVRAMNGSFDFGETDHGVKTVIKIPIFYEKKDSDY